MRVARFDLAAGAAVEEARRRGLFAIVRFQDIQDRSLVVSDGSLERVSASRASGVGVQVFTTEGWCGFASSDDGSPGAVGDLVRRAGALARSSGSLRPEVSHEVFALRGGTRRVVGTRARGLAATSLAEQTAALREANRHLIDLAPGFAVRSSHQVVDDEWRVVRSDGADVSFALPRAHAQHDLTAHLASGVVTASATVSGADAGVLLDLERARLLEQRALRALRRARAVLGAPPVRVGSSRLVIDHALAKGLAHEAFGHACETDTVDGSILATGGRLRLGETFGPSNVSIVDGPIPGDYADQGVSANGLDRETVAIIREGVLVSGLGDLFSARRAGSRVTGACRASGYRQRANPRMSNIRIVLADPIPLRVEAETIEPDDVASELHRAGLLAAGEPMLYLAGYRGGQAHPKRGDFMFACAAVYDLAAGAAPRQPAVLSGKSRSALRSIVAGFGELRLDAMGVCGKHGQNVPVSGGSHALLVLEAHPEIVVGQRG